MNAQLKEFVNDLVFLIHEKYNDNLQNTDKEIGAIRPLE